MFERLYFDTSSLIQNAWPKVSANLERLMKAAPIFHVSLFLPIPVEIELEQKWLRDLSDAEASVRRSLRNLDKVVAFAGSSAHSTVPRLADLQALYKEQVDEIKRTYDLKPVPFTLRRVDEFFEMAAKRQSPIQDGDKGFRDAVILFSVADHIRSSSGVAAALLAHDNVFRSEGVMKQLKEVGVILEVYQTIDAVVDELKKSVDVVVRGLWEQLEGSVLDIVRGGQCELEKFISANLEVPEEVLGVSFLGGVTLNRIELLEIQRVKTPHPLEHPDNGTMRISIDVSLRLHYETQEFPETPRQSLKVGDTSSALNRALNLGDIAPRTVNKTFDCVATVEGEGLVEGLRYKDVEFKSVKLQESPFSGLLAHILKR